ncbi:MAG TPA: hypothetical protein VMR77_02615 [Patescibacteria group bacterium]|nr:hypothetical protein [Patescibacteria group bacterium]
MAESLTFAKIVANPSAFSWSQVYSAGKLFAVISLEAQEENLEKDFLNILGKEILTTLEQEFFTLETKDLESIKAAVLTTAKKVPAEINCSFVIGALTNNILYLYILGNGRASLKRDGKLGNLIEAVDQESTALKEASGYLQDGDVVVLQTKQFCDVISAGTLSEFMDNLAPSEAAENLAPLVHEKEEAGAAAIIAHYKAPVAEEVAEPLTEEPEQEPEPEITAKTVEDEQNSSESPFYSPTVTRKTSIFDNVRPLAASFFAHVKRPQNLDLNHPRKVILTIVIVILVVFIGSVFFAINKQQNDKTQAAFQAVYPQALKNYNEGQSLLELNQNLARNDFQQAQQLLNNGKDKLPKDSKEEKQVLDLLGKVNSALSATSGVTNAAAKEVSADSSQLLLAETKNDGLYFAQDSSHIYGLTQTAVYTLNPDGTNKKSVITNDSDWKSVGGLSTYIGNLYILDKSQNQILKYVNSDSGFVKANYFSSTSPDLSKAVSIAIDSSIYVLTSDGNISKFTKGSSDTFTIAGLDTPLANPTRIYTNLNDDNVYVLDNGNQRIAVFDKSGNYKNQYQAAILKNAKDFEVLEQDKKIYVLSGGKTYEIDLK